MNGVLTPGFVTVSCKNEEIIDFYAGKGWKAFPAFLFGLRLLCYPMLYPSVIMFTVRGV